MFRVVAAVLAVAGFAACSPDTEHATAVAEPIETGPNTVNYAGLPPDGYAREGFVTVLFVHPDSIGEICGETPPLTTFACVRRTKDNVAVVVMPHPIVARGDTYAGLLEHELAHVAGWPGDHPMPATPGG